MSVLNTIKFIVNHPLNKGHKAKAIKRFLKWQIGSRLNPYPIVFPYTENSRLLVKKGLTGATGNLYCGLHEFEDMMFVLHFLLSTDVFIDIGANIGSYTILAGQEIGAKTLCFEPIPQTFKILEDNIRLNNIQNKVKAYNIGLGSQKGTLMFTDTLDTVNHVAAEGDTHTISVPVEIFDDLYTIENPTLIKIDVEGFETEVLKGMEKTLSNVLVKAVIIELNGSGTRYGYDEEKIHKHFLELGFQPHLYDPFERNIKAVDSYVSHNTIYIRDYEFAKDRISSAKRFKILEHSI